MEYTTNKHLTLHFYPSEIADLFCGMDNEEQAQFFNAVAEKSKQWEGSFESQMIVVVNNGGLNQEGRRIMKAIGESVQ